MVRSLALFVIGLVFGGGIGFAIAAGNGITFDGYNHADPTAHDGAQINHGMTHDAPLDVAAENAPKVSMMLMPDSMAGYNLHVTVENFAFSPQGASGAAVPGQGHAHVYINGEKLNRLYGEWMHIASLPKGDVTVEVTLNSNDHRPLAVEGTPISASTTLSVE
tara:strand:+ start:3243 stop:3731 length:489 start_codon:yes stop_codon:yes gene_type:complete